jgi:hypothetical protein
MKKLLTTIAALALVASAFSQSVNYGTTVVTGPYMVTTGASSNLTSIPIPVKPGYGVGIEAYFAGTNAGTALLVLNIDTSQDGSTWTTRAPGTGLRVGFVMNGATATRAYTNLPSALFDSAHSIRITQVTNAHTDSLFVSNIVAYRVARIPEQ